MTTIARLTLPLLTLPLLLLSLATTAGCWSRTGFGCESNDKGCCPEGTIDDSDGDCCKPEDYDEDEGDCRVEAFAAAVGEPAPPEEPAPDVPSDAEMRAAWMRFLATSR